MSIFLIAIWIKLISGLFSGWLIQVAHGFVSSLLFLFVGLFSHLIHSRSLFCLRVIRSYWFILALFLNIGAPMRSPFIREVFFFNSFISLGRVFIGFLVLSVLLISYYNLYTLLIVKNSKEPLHLSLNIRAAVAIFSCINLLAILL